MARKAKEPIEIIEETKINKNYFDGIQNSSIEIQKIIDEVEKTTKLTGMSDAFTILGNFSDLANLSVYEMLKKTKGYKNIINPKTGNFFRNLDEYCEEKMSYSRRRLDSLINNRNLIGKELYEKAEQIGLRQVDYNAMKALPANEQELVRRAVDEAQTKDEVIELIKDLSSKFIQETEVLKKQANEAKKELEISEAYNADTRKERDDLKLKLKKYELNTVPMDERLQSFGKKVALIQSEMDRLFEEKRQLLDMLYQMSLELMDKDPEYVRGEYYPLPKTMQNAISVLNGSSIFSLDQAKQFHRLLWDKFLPDLEDIQHKTFNLHNESLTINENN